MLQENPELYAKHEDYRKKRGVFNEKFKYDGKKRQKYYIRRTKTPSGTNIPTSTRPTGG